MRRIQPIGSIALPSCYVPKAGDGVAHGSVTCALGRAARCAGLD